MHFSTQTTLLIIASSARLVLGGPLQFEVIGSRTARRHSDVSRRNVRRASSELENMNDIHYTTEITLGGPNEIYNVELDTGSSSFWVTPPEDLEHVANSKDTGRKATIFYVDHTASGSIKTADLGIAGFNIPDQSFIEISDDEGTAPGAGVIGLSIDRNSKILDALKSTVGFSPIHRVFESQKNLPHIMTMLLGRTVEPSGGFPGTFTIGSVLDQYKAVESQPKLKFEGMHHRFQMDEDAITVEDKVIPVESLINKGSKQLVAFTDSGFSMSQVPAAVAKALYGSYPGAENVELEDVGNVWLVPCQQEVQITFQLGGKSIPIHPLDATLTGEQLDIEYELRNARGQEMCVGSFQPIAQRMSKPIDILLGMPFLRNVYSLTNFGDKIFGDANTDGYAQLLPTTNAQRAHQDFVAVRGQ